MNTERSDKRLAAVGLFLIGCYFFRLTRPALHTGFSSDDLMNLHRSWSFPLRALAKANLLFFLPSDFIRPMGSLWYRTVYYFAGFHGGPFHAADIAILLVNIFLTYCVARQLTGSRLAALAAALLSCYRRKSEAVYFDTGYIYDVLCYFFLFAALAWYIAIRQRGRAPRIGELAGLLALFVCALNSKELAVALPVMLALYELLYERRRSWWTLAAMSAMAAAMIAFRVGALAANDEYRSVFTWARFAHTNGNFLNELFLAPDWFTPLRVVAFWGALLAVALLARSKPLLFAVGFFFAAAMPIAFVPARGASQYYIPTFGCALYAGCVLAGCAQAGFRRLAGGWNYWAQRAAAAGLLVAIACPLYANYKKKGMEDVYSMTRESPAWMSLSRDMLSLRPAMAPGSRVLFLNDPMLPNTFDLFFLWQLTYRDRSLQVDQAKRMEQLPTARQMLKYDAVFDYQNGHLTDATPPEANVDIHPAIREFFDGEWKPISASHPARAGERVIVKAVDLGPTDPETASGAAFPLDPFARSLLRPKVLVNGRPAEILEDFGSPGEIGLYRMDFRVPAHTESGTARVELTVAGHKAPPAAIAVRH